MKPAAAYQFRFRMFRCCERLAARMEMSGARGGAAAETRPDEKEEEQEVEICTANLWCKTPLFRSLASPFAAAFQLPPPPWSRV